MFEKASRLKLRFGLTKGIATVDDLWDLPLTHRGRDNLNSLAVMYHKKLAETNISFVDDVAKEDEVLRLKYEIVKHIIKVKKEEFTAKEKEAVRESKKAELLELLVDKRKENLKKLSEEEIERRLNDL